MKWSSAWMMRRCGAVPPPRRHPGEPSVRRGRVLAATESSGWAKSRPGRLPDAERSPDEREAGRWNGPAVVKIRHPPAAHPAGPAARAGGDARNRPGRGRPAGRSRSSGPVASRCSGGRDRRGRGPRGRRRERGRLVATLQQRTSGAAGPTGQRPGDHGPGGTRAGEAGCRPARGLGWYRLVELQFLGRRRERPVADRRRRANLGRCRWRCRRARPARHLGAPGDWTGRPGKADAAAGVRWQWLEGDLRRACSQHTRAPCRRRRLPAPCPAPRTAGQLHRPWPGFRYTAIGGPSARKLRPTGERRSDDRRRPRRGCR